jgi:capsular exopolysaccharide synthesis family protein
MDNELKRLETFSDMLANRIKEINISEDTGLVNANVIEVAVPGKSPVRPEKVKTMSTGTALSFLLGVGFALLLDFMDQRIRSGAEVGALLQTTVLGVIPHISAKEATDVRGRKVMLDPTSNVAEAYRTLRTAMHFGGRKIKKILVTSPAPGDGKSTSISNLAIAMAQSGRKVLLIDADCRRPTQHKIFELSDEKGLASVLLGEDALDGAVQWTKIPNLDLLPCGPVPSNPSEILDSQAFLDLMGELEGRYDHILIDAPPLIPVTDARILAALCDVTLLVLRAEKTTRRLAQYAKESLDSVGAKLAGVIVNDVTRRSQGYGYYYGYGYDGYGYKYGVYGNGKKAKVKENGKAHAAA